jgi:hypothetical protein
LPLSACCCVSRTQTDPNSLQSHPFFSIITWATGALSLIGALVFVLFGLKLYCGVRRMRKAGVLHKAATRVSVL